MQKQSGRRATTWPAAGFDERERPSHETNFGFSIYNEIIIVVDPV